MAAESERAVSEKSSTLHNVRCLHYDSQHLAFHAEGLNILHQYAYQYFHFFGYNPIIT
jgi:hypothetical protein